MQKIITETGNQEGIDKLRWYLWNQIDIAGTPDAFKICNYPKLKAKLPSNGAIRKRKLAKVTGTLQAELHCMLSSFLFEELERAKDRFESIVGNVEPWRAAILSLDTRCDKEKWVNVDAQNAPLGMSIEGNKIYMACAMPEIVNSTEFTFEIPGKIVVSRALPHWYVNAIKDAPAWATRKHLTAPF